MTDVPARPAERARLILVLMLLLYGACTPEPAAPPLNSGQIEARFGNYGVDVLFADDRTRLSSLFSTSGNGKTTRTFAIVEFVTPVHPDLADAHARIVAGGSIGAVFRSAGWEIRKDHVFLGDAELDAAPDAMFNLMRIPRAARLATHVYDFVLDNGKQAISYARIVEIHHPDYFNATQLRRTYRAAQPNPSAHALLSEFVPNSLRALQQI